MKKRIAALMLALVLMLCGTFAMSASAEGEPLVTGNLIATQEEHTHDYGEWKLAESDIFLGNVERECECGETQSAPVIAVAGAGIVGIAVLVLLCVLLAKAAGVIWKVLRKVIFGLVIVFALLLLFGGVVKSVSDDAEFGKSLLDIFASLVFGRGFYTDDAASCIYNQFGHISAIVMNSLCYLSIVSIIAAIISGIRKLIEKGRQVGKAAATKAGEFKDAVAEALTGKNEEKDK